MRIFVLFETVLFLEQDHRNWIELYYYCLNNFKVAVQKKFFFFFCYLNNLIVLVYSMFNIPVWEMSHKTHYPTIYRSINDFIELGKLLDILALMIKVYWQHGFLWLSLLLSTFFSHSPCRLGLLNVSTVHLCREVDTSFIPNEATCLLWVVTCNTSGHDPGGWTVLDLTTKVVKWLEIHHFGPYWARCKQSERLVMWSLSTHNCPRHILQIALLANK